MYKQIVQALDKIDSNSINQRQRFLAIMGKYARDEISLDQAYYDLIEDELIPMPQRCGMFAKVSPSPEDELCLKRRILEMG